jgi:aspartyl-tRNA(Asn)/glutamyl-tRNA(Gln) amidotransferase subunit A
VLEVAGQAVRVLGGLAHVEEVSPALGDPFECVRTLLATGTAGAHRDDFAEVRDRLDPERVPVVEEGFRLTAADVGAALIQRARWVEGMRAFMEPYDLLVTPTSPVTAFEIGREGPASVAGHVRPGLSWSAFSYPFNLTGQPAASIPCGFAEGLPVGLQIVGRWRDDATVLRASAALEAARPWADLWPEILSAAQKTREETFR